MASEDRQLGDFIKGRLLFVEDYCREHSKEQDQVMEVLRREARRLAGSPEKAEFLDQKVFQGVVLSSAYFPEWVDGVFLEAMTIALKGAGAPLFTTSSNRPCVTFEAGRFNAHRQADSVFKVYFFGKKPEEWLRSTFLAIYRQCYGEAVASKFSVEEVDPKHFRVHMDNRGLGKASRMDCSTGVGYLFGALEKLGASDILVTHDKCGADPGKGFQICVYDITWK